jgi:predicted N-acetyltransferase YhbS
MSDAIQAYLRKSASLHRDVEQIGPFFATFTVGSTSTFVNYAIPDGGAEPTPADVAALIAAFERRERIPRLEYLPGLSPAVEPALLTAGFTVEDRVPLMEWRPDSAHAEETAGFEFHTPETDDELLAHLQVQHEAFGDKAPTDDDIAGLRRQLGSGALAVFARDTTTGEPAGAGNCTAVRDGMSEVVGIAVREPDRRRGLGGAVTLRLSEAARAGGAETVFLTPAGDPQERVYARVGYRRIDSMLFLWKKDS